MVLAALSITYNSLGVRILAAEEKGNARTGYKGQAENLSKPAGGKGYAESLLSSTDQMFLRGLGDPQQMKKKIGLIFLHQTTESTQGLSGTGGRGGEVR